MNLIFTKDAKAKYSGLDKYIQAQTDSLFELFSPFSNIMEQNFGNQLVNINSDSNLKYRYEEWKNTQGGVGILDDSLNTQSLKRSEIKLINHVKDLKASANFHMLKWVSYVSMVISMLYVQNTASTVNITIGLSIIGCSELNIPLLSRNYCTGLMILIFISVVISVFRLFFKEKGSYLESGILDEYQYVERVVCLVVNFFQFLLLIPLCRLSVEAFPGAIGGIRNNIISFHNHERKKSKEWNYHFGDNVDLPRLDEIDNFRI